MIGAVLGVAHEPKDALREYDCGVIEGTGGEASRQLYKQVLDEWILHGRWDARIEGGESFLEMRDRFVPFIEGLLRETAARRDIILVAHGGILRCMLPLVLENVDFDYAMTHRLGYASQVVAQARDGALVCLDWAGSSVPDTCA
jgi:probable phosphoglycerate mutase